jgi:hypothetical protein
MTRRHPYYWGKDRRSPEEIEWASYTSMVIATAPTMPNPLPCEIDAHARGADRPSIYEILAEIEALKPAVEEARRVHFERARAEAPVAVKGRWEAMEARKVAEEVDAPLHPARPAVVSCAPRGPNAT